MLAACDMHTTGRGGTSSPLPTASVTTTSTVNVGLITAGFPGAIDAGSTKLTAANITQNGYIQGNGKDGSIIFVSSLQAGLQSLQAWYPKTGKTVTIALERTGMFPGAGSSIAVNAKWAAVVYEPLANTQSGGGSLMNWHWELRIFDRTSGSSFVQAQDMIGENLPKSWNTSLEPEVALSGDLLVWREFVQKSDGIHSVVLVTDLATRQSTTVADEVSDSKGFFASPTADGGNAAWCDYQLVTPNPNAPVFAGKIMVYDLIHHQLTHTIKPSDSTGFTACTPSIFGDTLAFSLYKSTGGDINGIAYTSLSNPAPMVIASSSNLPNFVSVGDGVIAWSNQNITGRSVNSAYDVKTHQTYTFDTTSAQMTVYASGDTLFWAPSPGTIAYAVVGG